MTPIEKRILRAASSTVSPSSISRTRYSWPAERVKASSSTMVEPAFEKFSPDTVTTRTPFIAAVRRTRPASILKHFSPPGEQNAPVSDRRLMIGSSTKCTEAVSCQPSFSIFANTGSTTSATPSPEKDHFDGRQVDVAQQRLDLGGRQPLREREAQRIDARVEQFERLGVGRFRGT